MANLKKIADFSFKYLGDGTNTVVKCDLTLDPYLLLLSPLSTPVQNFGDIGSTTANGVISTTEGASASLALGIVTVTFDSAPATGVGTFTGLLEF